MVKYEVEAVIRFFSCVLIFIAFIAMILTMRSCGIKEQCLKQVRDADVLKCRDI